VISKATGKFWKCYEQLPAEVQKKAKEAYALFSDDPWYPSLHYKRVHSDYNKLLKQMKNT
jgi:hypothetical protein